MKDFQVTIPAGGSQLTTWSGKVLSVKSCTLPISAAFDGKNSNVVKSGTVLNNDEPFSFVNFLNPNSVAVTVYFYIGQTALSFAPDDNSQSINKTVILANGGVATLPAIPTAKKTGGTNWSPADGVAVNLGLGGLYVPGYYLGHKRKQIVFQNTTLNGNTNDVAIVDLNGIPVLRMLANNIPYTFESDADFYVVGLGGTVGQGAFWFHEYYYAANV